MKAVVLYGPKDVNLGDLPVLPLAADEVRVRIAYCGICGSDFHKVAGKKNTHPVKYPVALGHEISGVVAEIGSAVKGLQVGDRVTVDPNWSCGKCRYCQEGKTSFCEHARGVVKGMAEFVVSPVSNVYRLPDALPLRAAALTEPLSCCLRGMDLLDIKQGERVTLVGFGAIGCMMLQLIRAAGAGEIAVIEYNEAKRDLALELGADVFLCSKAQDEIAAYAEANSVDKVIECVGIAAAQETALAVAGKGATVVMFGVSDSAEKLPISLYDAFTKELTIKTSFINPHTTARAIRLLSAGILRTDKIIAAVLSPEEAVEEFKAPHYSKLGKTLVLMDLALENA